MNTELDLQLAVEADTPSKQDFQTWVDLANEQKQPASVCLRICSSNEIQTLNKTYRQKDKPTNVLSFAYTLEGDSPSPEDEPPHLGDIIICDDVVKQEACKQHKSKHDHYAHMVIHGMLHLQGYNHIQDDEARIMEAREVDLLRNLGIKNPYEEHNE
ncbi:MAG: rRNA maturation RNase YbeY [Gammaproteobacteria bacterium CG11_big_fil_rev_8_21_14_0_20_46_22]|nr:MAG: rRNA maturation RNase YbeY [Gammaproteobacteria bacterium CG12_big_fil_rev_8_21_14_0_65_46_12]PIR10924.1 MAG: rRNA maturation RNase YbeY [Gammaproteobacteria bacterium CG11_big_fil_rev_8_21_14_0_20_46_22]